MWRIPVLLVALGLGACASHSSASSPSYYDYSQTQSYVSYDSLDGEYGGYAELESVQISSTGSSTSRSERQGRSQGPTFSAGVMTAQAPPPAPVPTTGLPDEPTPSTDASESAEPGAGLLLIYNGTVVLAVYDVEAKQTEAITLIEAMGGFAAERSSSYLKFRIPAERFREALDALATLGDVLSVDWNAEDVTEEFRDLDIRLANAMQMRGRLEDLLTRAQTVEEALAIEAELERVTLEIERIRGRLRMLEDLIAYSTIVLSFQQTYVAGVPEASYRLPFTWLNTLGLPNLLSLN